jgi:hypothetical protein
MSIFQGIKSISSDKISANLTQYNGFDPFRAHAERANLYGRAHDLLKNALLGGVYSSPITASANI